MRLFHFSDDPDIQEFVPRPVQMPVERRAGSEWLNGPLVWAIDEVHEPLYLFPRECPRILAWVTRNTAVADRAAWLGDSDARMVAWIEESWHCVLKRQRSVATNCRRRRSKRSAMSVCGCREALLRVRTLSGLEAQLRERAVELRFVTSLLPLKDIWQSSVHASGLRLRNVVNWGQPGWPHSTNEGAAGT